MISVKVHVNVNALNRFRSMLEAGLNHAGPIGRAIDSWAATYLGFLYGRYKAEGYGDWPPLARSTIRKKGHTTILRDTDTLMEAFNPDTASFIAQPIHGGVRIDINTAGTHPSGHPIATLLGFHQEGMGNNPTREVVVSPPQNVVEKLVSDLDKAVKETKLMSGS